MDLLVRTHQRLVMHSLSKVSSGAACLFATPRANFRSKSAADSAQSSPRGLMCDTGERFRVIHWRSDVSQLLIQDISTK